MIETLEQARSLLRTLPRRPAGALPADADLMDAIRQLKAHARHEECCEAHAWVAWEFIRQGRLSDAMTLAHAGFTYKDTRAASRMRCALVWVRAALHHNGLAGMKDALCAIHELAVTFGVPPVYRQYVVACEKWAEVVNCGATRGMVSAVWPVGLEGGWTDDPVTQMLSQVAPGEVLADWPQVDAFSDTLLAREIRLMKALLLARVGDDTEALCLLKDTTPLPDDVQGVWVGLQEALLRAWLRLEAGDHAGATAALLKLREAARTAGHEVVEWQVAGLLSGALEKGGQLAEALRLMREYNQLRHERSLSPIRQDLMRAGAGRTAAPAPARPDEPEYLRKVASFVQQRLAQKVTVTSVVDQMLVNRRTLEMACRRFRGCTVRELIVQIKLAHARHLMETSQLSLASIRQAVGYDSASVFRSDFVAVHGSELLMRYEPAEVRTLMDGTLRMRVA